MFLIFLKKIDFTKIINLLKIYISFFISEILKKQIRWGMPYSISIEPTNNCNLKCSECPSGNNQLTRARGTIENNLYYKIIDESYKYLLNLFLYFQGEPFLTKNIYDLINYANNKNVFTATSTNGHFLTKQNSEKIIKSGLNKLIISLDGTTQETYEKYRINGDIEKVKKGIKNIVDAKTKFKSKTPFIEVQFLVLSSNEHQIVEIKKFCKEQKIDKLSFKSAQIYNFETNTSLIPKSKKYSRYKYTDGRWQLKKKIKNHCFRLWNSVVITWKGDLLPCCFDKDAQYPFGNVNDENIEDLITNSKFKTFAKQLQTDRSKIDICRNCSE